jgi:hypothetical protein
MIDYDQVIAEITNAVMREARSQSIWIQNRPLLSALKAIRRARLKRLRDKPNEALLILKALSSDEGLKQVYAEHPELSDAVGKFEDQEVAIAQAIVLSVSRSISSLVSSMVLQSEVILNKTRTKQELLCLGPKVGESYWAYSVKVASDYVRHWEEWPAAKREMKEGVSALSGNPLLRLDRQQRRTAEAVIALGVSPKEIFLRRADCSLFLVQLLRLDQRREFVANYEGWRRAAGKVSGFHKYAKLRLPPKAKRPS